MAMLALLGQSPETDDRYKVCRDLIARLRKEIEEKQRGQSTEVLKTQVRNHNDNDVLPHSDQPNNRRRKPYRFSVRKKLPGHFGKIYSLYWSSDGNEICSASQDGKILIWNAHTTNKRIAIPLRSAWVMTCAYSPQGTFVGSGGLDNLCSIFNIKDSVGWELKQPHRELQRHEGYLSCCRFVDENHILTASGDASCLLWDIERQTPINSFIEHTGDVESVSVYHQKNIFVSGAIDATAKVWDLNGKNKCIATFKGHTSDINSVQWFPDGDAFASGSDDATCRLFDLRAHRQLNIYGAHEIFSTITAIDFSKSGYFLFAGYDENPFCVAWNTCTTEQETTLEHPTRAACLQTSPLGNAVATGCWDKTLRLWA